MKSYQYRSHQLDLVLAHVSFETSRDPDAYLTDSVDLRALRDSMNGGFRWVRTEGDIAIFEKEVTHE